MNTQPSHTPCHHHRPNDEAAGIMSLLIESTARPRRFTNLAELDHFVHHRYRDEIGAEHVCLEVGSIRRMVTYFDRLEHQIKCVSSSTTPSWRQHQRGKCLTPEGRLLWQVLRDASTEAIHDVCEGRRLNPWLVIGLRLARKWGPILQRFTIGGPNDLNVNEDQPRRIMTHIVKVIRRACRSARFRNWVNNDTRNAKENYFSCAELMIDLLDRNARLLILRIDLYFEGDAKILSESHAAEQAYNKFLRHLREEKIVPNLLGYIGKRENGLERRIHYHVLVALDGDLHQQSHARIEQLGKFWVRQCVGDESLASYFNCWLRRHEYEFSCMGVLHYTDSRMLMGLRLALEYLCKEGAHVLVDAVHGRNLRKSIRPRRLAGTARRGAPRKHGNDLSVAKQVLLTHSKPHKRSHEAESRMRQTQCIRYIDTKLPGQISTQ